MNLLKSNYKQNNFIAVQPVRFNARVVSPGVLKNNTAEAVVIARKKMELILFSSFLLCLSALLLCIYNSVNHAQMFSIYAVITGLTGYLSSVKCIRFLMENNYSNMFKVITFFIILLNCMLLSLAIAYMLQGL